MMATREKRTMGRTISRKELKKPRTFWLVHQRPVIASSMISVDTCSISRYSVGKDHCTLATMGLRPGSQLGVIPIH